ncbi:MAG TPA: hypothetical protein VFB58_09205 [Chloroflexota bacterium]|nr:hypothetical protein [Chloroflexota bacterium]
MRRPIRSSLTIGISTAIILSAVILLLGAMTAWLDSPLGIGRHKAATSTLSVVTVGGTGRTVLLSSGGMIRWGPAWSRSGKSLVYSLGTARTGVFTLVASFPGLGQHALTHDRRNNYLPVWSPNGKLIAYISQQGAKDSTAELYVIGADGRGKRRLTYNEAWEYGASWSPDGKRIAYGSEQGGIWHVWIMNANGSGARMLPGTEKGNAPDWSPNGRTIAFTSDRTGNDNIYAVSPSGGVARRLTTGPCHSDNARWSPDGKLITYAVFCPHGWTDIYVMDADGSHPRNLTNTPSVEEEVPAWLPDGRRIGFAAFQVERDGLWPGPALRGVGFGLLLGLLAAAATSLRSRHSRPVTASSRV